MSYHIQTFRYQLIYVNIMKWLISYRPDMLVMAVPGYSSENCGNQEDLGSAAY